MPAKENIREMPLAGEPIRMRPVWFAVIAVGAATLGAGGWYLTSQLWPSSTPAPSGHSSDTPAISSVNDARTRVEAVLVNAQEYTPFFKLLRTTFPADYAVDVDRFAARAASNGHLDSIDNYFNEAHLALRKTRGVVAANASNEALTRIFDADAAVLRALGAADAHLCVDFIDGGATEAYYAFAAAHRAIVAELGNAGLAAIIDGGKRKSERTTPGEKDVQVLEKALADSGLTKAEIGVLLDAKAPDPPIPDARMCTIQQTNLAALKRLPDDERWRIYRFRVEWMART